MVMFGTLFFCKASVRNMTDHNELIENNEETTEIFLCQLLADCTHSAIIASYCVLCPLISSFRKGNLIGTIRNFALEINLIIERK